MVPRDAADVGLERLALPAGAYPPIVNVQELIVGRWVCLIFGQLLMVRIFGTVARNEFIPFAESTGPGQ